ncbi:MAG: glutamate--tRNA ligase [Myxococcota bacterium]
MNQVRVRFAPSPTGYLHIGGVRTALYSWLWARKHGGTFVLRIEDTDAARSTSAAVQVIFDSLEWLEIDWDEGPVPGAEPGAYFQSQRKNIYAEYAEKLIKSGRAYRCYCTKEELAQQRKQHEAAGHKGGFRYPGTCRDRTDEPDAPWVVRLRLPEQRAPLSWHDRVKGQVTYPFEQFQDFVLIRDNGVPLYNFGCVVDDHAMGISLVTRGDDHLINTPRQMLIYEALGLPLPEFAHVPLILAANGSKLSKRHASVAVLDYRDQGYVPDGVLNYLARIGWSHGDQEIFSREELIEKFDWAQVGVQGGKYDPKKFLSVQAEHLRRLSDRQVAQESISFIDESLGVQADNLTLLAAMPHAKPRCSTLSDVAYATDYLFRDPPEMDEKAVKKLLIPDAKPLLLELAQLLSESSSFDAESLSDLVSTWVERRELKMKTIAQPARVALTGRSKSPGLFDVMTLLGKERTIERLRQAADRIE